MQNRFMLQGDALLLDMLQAASDAVEFVAALDQAQFIGSKPTSACGYSLHRDHWGGRAIWDVSYHVTSYLN